MKILFYNWVDYLDDEKRGGGVTVYQRNVINALQDTSDVDAWFLSAGISYDIGNAAPRWDHIKHGGAENKDKRFEVVNSGVLAPSHHSFGNPAQFDHPETVEVIADFVEKNGPFDVLHLNNLEGVPATVLALKERFPEMRVILSLHNYYPFCPQVNLWHNEKKACSNFKNGRKCVHCLPSQHDERVIRLANGVAFSFKKNNIRPGTRIFDRAFIPAMRLARHGLRAYRKLRPQKQATQPAALETRSLPIEGSPLRQLKPLHPTFRERRETFVQMINTHCDAVLCVSDRVGEIAKQYGIDPAIVHTSYIGTRQAERFDDTSPKEHFLKPDGTITLGYLGYMRRDKGFYFLLDALEALPEETAARIHLVVAARNSDGEAMERLELLDDQLGSVLYADGYSHDDLDDILETVDVGVVPVLWEDNLPQVAIEMHARHIPIITSNMGGAQELANAPAMTFAAGSKSGFRSCLVTLLNGEIDSAAYWKTAARPVSMSEHMDDLLMHYRAEAPSQDREDTTAILSAGAA
ncbi:MAG: glycosyltransferase [Pseudoruegeria sp.]